MSKSKKPTVVVGVPVPPPDPRPYVPHITLPCNRETDFVALHNEVKGLMMHWHENHNVPHQKEAEWCAGCRAGTSMRWTGFLGVISTRTHNRFILQVPAAAFRESGHFRDLSDGKALAGTVFTAYRFGERKVKNRPARIELVQDHLPYPRVLPFDLAPALLRYWPWCNAEMIEFVKCPEKSEMQKAQEFITFAEMRKQHEQQQKGGGK